jgi:hypothetical protein
MHTHWGRYNSFITNMRYYAMIIKQALPLFFTSILLPFAHSQQTVKFLILDSISQSPVAYAQIFNANKSIGTISDEQGQVLLTGIEINDSINIVCIGYESKTIVVYKSHEKIALSPKPFLIREVVINAPRTKKRTNSNSKIKSSSSLCNYFDRGYQVVTFKSPETHHDPIYKVSVYIKKEINCSGKIRLRFYNIDSNGMPGENILPKSIIVGSKGAKGWINFDLIGLDVKIPDEGAFIGLEFLDFVDDNKEKVCVGLSDQSSTNNTWVQSVGGKWHQLQFLKNKNGMPYNIMVKVE